MKKVLLLWLLANTGLAADSLFFWEAQGVVGYSKMEDNAIYRSGHEEDAMQKSSLGFDYLKKISGEGREIGTFALQSRLVYDEIDDKAQLQFYNAYLKGKTGAGDVWLGHNRIAFGLSSYMDTHGELLQNLSMYGVSFDRDWGGGYSKDFASSDLKFAVSNGSGMATKNYGNYLATGRFSYGVLNYDNYNIGISVLGGRILDTKGYEIADKELDRVSLVGLDFAYNFDNLEQKLEVDWGKKNKRKFFAGFYRFGIGFLEENRLKLELQGVYTKETKIIYQEQQVDEMGMMPMITESEEDLLVEDYFFGTGLSYKINSSLTIRLMYEKEYKEMKENKVILQLYYYGI
jgi:hypothetical protein